METSERNVKNNVRRYRTKREWTLADMSARMTEVGYPMSVKVLNKLESFEAPHARGVGVDDLVALAAAFDVTVDELLLPVALTDGLINLAAELAGARSDLLDRVHELDNAKKDLAVAVSAVLLETQSVMDHATALMHLADEQGVDFDELIRLVREHWSEWTADQISGVPDLFEQVQAELTLLEPLLEEMAHPTLKGETDGPDD